MEETSNVGKSKKRHKGRGKQVRNGACTQNIRRIMIVMDILYTSNKTINIWIQTEMNDEEVKDGSMKNNNEE